MNRLLISTFCLFLSLILGVAFISPKYNDFKLVQAKVEEKKAELESQEEYFARLRETAEKLKEHEPQLAIIDTALPPKPSLTTLFNYLQTAASQNGLVVTGIIPISTVSAKDIKETRVILEMAGSYSSLKSFLLTLEKSARIIETESISFSTPKEGSIFTFKLRIKTHSY